MTLKFAITLACATLESKVFAHPDYIEAVRVIRAHFPEAQAQDCTREQLRRAIPIVDNAGLYDAADYLRGQLKSWDEKSGY